MSTETSTQLELPIDNGSEELMELDPLKLFTEKQIIQLRKNGNPNNHGKDHVPVALLLSTRTRSQFLLTELHHEYPHLAYGIADIRNVGVELGYIDLQELVNRMISTEKMQNPEAIISDKGTFEGTLPLSEYLNRSLEKGYLIINDKGHADLVNTYFTSRVENLNLNM